MHILGPKKCLFWCYFFMSVQKVQSIDYPNAHFWAENCFRQMTDFWLKFHCAYFGTKKVSVMDLFLLVGSKCTVYRLYKSALLGSKFSFLQMTDFWLKSHQSTIVHVLGPKKCLFWCYYFMSVQKVQSIDCTKVHFWALNFFFCKLQIFG